MRIRPEEIVKLAYFAVLFASLLLLSAVAEHGTTELSRFLVPKSADVPRMIESIAAGMTAAVAGGTALAYIEKNK